MAQKFENEVVILLKARDETAKTFGKVTKSTKQFADNLNAKAGAGAANNLAKVFGVLGSIEGALKGVNAVTELFSGNIEEAADKIKSMPLGIGPVATAIQDIQFAWFGVNDAIEEANRLVDQQTQRNKVLETSAKRRIAGIATLESLNQELALKKAGEFEAQTLALRFDTQRRIKKIREDGAKEQSEFSENLTRQAVAKALELEKLKLKEINLAHSAAMQKEGEAFLAELKKKEEAEIKSAEAVAKAKSDANKKLIDAHKAAQKKADSDAEKERQKADALAVSPTDAREQQSRFLTGAAEAASQFAQQDPVVVEQKKTNTALAVVSLSIDKLTKQLMKNPTLRLAEGTAAGV